MAAPTIPSSQKKTNLRALYLKENTPKVTRKNILCPVSQEWPRAPKTVEESILAKLTEKLTSAVNVFKPIKKSLIEDKSEKARIRSQLEIGTSCVFRALERDTLACILVSGQATPAIAVDHIISLGRERGCPVLCLDQLAPTVARATKSKCLPLAIGFKKMEDNSHLDFSEIISLVKENVEVVTPQSTGVKVCIDLTSRESVGKTKTNKCRPKRVNKDMEKEILEDLKRIFSEALTNNAEKEKSVKQKKKDRKKRNLKDAFHKGYHCHFDIGKRTITGILERGKLQVILISEEILPVLLSETQSCSLLSIAATKKCLVVLLPGLVDTMRALCGGSVSVLGLKNITSIQDGQKHFKQVIDKCLHAVLGQTEELVTHPECKETPAICSDPHIEKMSCESASADYCNRLIDKDSQGINHDVTKMCKDSSGIVKDSTRNDKDSTINDKDSKRTNSDDEADDDYSYLYILKKDSKEFADVQRELKATAENAGKNSFSGDYISLTPDSTGIKVQSSKSSGKMKAGTARTNVNTSLSSQITTNDSNSAGAGDEVSSCEFKDSLIPFVEFSTSASPNAGPGLNDMKLDAVSDTTSSDDKPLAQPLFSLCRSGDRVTKAEKADSKTNFQKKQQSDGKFSNSSQENVLGVKELAQSEGNKTKGIDYISLGESSKNTKKAIKRKLQKDETFVSFAYTESNIRTMTSDPSKKKNKKKKKK